MEVASSPAVTAQGPLEAETPPEAAALEAAPAPALEARAVEMAVKVMIKRNRLGGPLVPQTTPIIPGATTDERPTLLVDVAVEDVPRVIPTVMTLTAIRPIPPKTNASLKSTPQFVNLKKSKSGLSPRSTPDFNSGKMIYIWRSLSHRIEMTRKLCHG